MCPRDRVPTRSGADPLLEQVIGDRYRILQRIGAGGMGQVYRAAHARIATLFAVKVLFGDLAHDSTMRSRFQREAEAASCLHSRRIVRVVDFGESSEGLLYLVMELLEGASLTSMLERERTIVPRRAVDVARQVARGLAHAHDRGVVHRDLKPDNVMLVEEDEEPDVVKLLDFGVARLKGSNRLTQYGQAVGTPTYMAPEQFLGIEVDGRADLYSLGVILYEMLTGDPPFISETLPGLVALHQFEPAPPIRDRGPYAPLAPRLASAVHRLLAKDPNDRFPSARALLDALQLVDERSTATSLPAAPAAPAPAPAPASTSTRSYLISERAAEVIHAAIQVGAPTYNRNDHAGCFQIYRQTAQDLLEGPLEPSSAPAAAARLRAAIQRADAMESATYAAWEMRYGFDDLLHAANHALVVSAGPGSIAQELAIAEELAAPHYAAGHLDLIGDFYLEFIRLLAAQIKRTSDEPGLSAWLDEVLDVATRAGGGERALASLPQALDALRRGFRPTAAGLPSIVTLAQCGELPDLSARIIHAIGVGAPAYNAGDIEACYRVYRETAESITREIGGAPGCAEIGLLLGRALDEAAKLGPDSAAWALRRAFDHLLAAASEANARASRS